MRVDYGLKEDYKRMMSNGYDIEKQNQAGAVVAVCLMASVLVVMLAVVFSIN